MPNSNRMLAFAIIILIVGMMDFPSTTMADTKTTKFDGKYLYLESDGSGSSKDDAVNSAWVDAVRTAIRMFMVGKVTVSNETIKEKSDAYTSSHPDSYEVLMAKQSKDIWNVKIKGKVEKTFLEEVKKTGTPIEDYHSTVAQMLPMLKESPDESDSSSPVSNTIQGAFASKHLNAEVDSTDIARSNAVPAKSASKVDAKPTGFDAKYVYVEADGSGTSRTEAVHSAWMEAVRTAVGMFMIGNTNINNDDIQEKITAYSRGHVDSYKVLSANQSDGIWNVRIKAKVEKDFLMEAQKTTDSSELNSNRLAQVLSTAKQSTDAFATLDNFVMFNDPKGLLDYQFDLEQKDGVLYAMHLIKVNFKNYQRTVVKNVDQLLSKFVKRKFETVHEQDAVKLLNIKLPKQISYMQKFNPSFVGVASDGGKIIELWAERNKSIIYTCHDEKLMEQISLRFLKTNSYEINTYVNVTCNGETEKLYGKRTLPAELLLSPFMRFPTHHQIVIVPCINTFNYMLIAQKLDLTSDQISKISKISGGYELTKVGD